MTTQFPDIAFADQIAAARADLSKRTGLASIGQLPAFVSSSSSFPATPSAQQLLDYPTIKGSRVTAVGIQATLWNGSAWVDDVPSDGYKARSATGNLALSALSTKAQADGPQFVDGNRWTWNAGSTAANGGTVVAALTTGFWLRELSGKAMTPEMFGAKGDGTTDDTAAVRATISASTGRTVEYNGTYLLSPTTTIIFPTLSTHRMGSGASFKLAANVTIGTPGISMTYVFSILTDNVLLENWEMDGNYTNQTYRVGGVVGYNARKPWLIRPVFTNFSGVGYLLQNCPNALVENCIATICGMATDAQGGASTGGAFGVDSTVLPSDPYYAVNNVARGGNYSNNGLDGISISTPGGRADGLTANSNGQGVNVISASVGAAGIYYLAGDNTTITNCTAAFNTGNGIDTGPNTALVKGVRILNNTCYMNGSAGIQADDVGNTLIEGNVCYNNGQRGYNNQRAGILLASFNQVQNAVVRNNRCYDTQTTKTQTWGLGIGSRTGGSFTTTDLLVEGNDFVGNKLGAIGSDSNVAYAGLVSSGFISSRRNLGHQPAKTLATGNNVLNPINEFMLLTPTGTSNITSITVGRAQDLLHILVLGNSVVFKATGGNLTLKGGLDQTLGGGQAITLICDGSNWIQLSAS